MFQVKNEAARATVYIYGTIGADWWSPEDENRAKEFSKTLDELSPKPVDIRIDSAGGDVYEGFAIASAIQRYEGETHAYVDGLAASAASYIALMADKVSMNDYAMLMIHNAWTIAIGNRDELRDMAERLEALDDTIAQIIANRSALDIDQVRAAMCAETWYSAADAAEAGMCDEVIETGQRMAASLDRAIAKHFNNIPEGIGVTDTNSLRADAMKLGEITLTASGITCSAAALTADRGAIADVGVTTIAVHDDGASHAVSTIHDNEARDAEGAILLGKRVYRKEQ